MVGSCRIAPCNTKCFLIELESISILVIEDNPGDFLLIREYLEEQFASLKIEQAKKYSDAVELLSNPDAVYNVVLLDLTLPDNTGESLINGITQLCPNIPVIVLTGFSDLEFSIKSLSLNISDYLLKDDINAFSLYKSIKYNIERKKVNRLLEESEKRYSDLFQQSPQPMWLLDIHSLDIAQVNRAAIQQYGYTEEEFLTLKLYNIVVDELKMEDKFRAVLSISNNADVYKGRFKHRKKSGELIDVDIYGTQMEMNGRTYESAIAIDVTEQIRAEHLITKAIIKTQEDERYEIGTELHDNVCQILASSQLSLEMLGNFVPNEAENWLQKSKKFVGLALEEIRNISHRLAPSFFDEKTIEETYHELLININPNNKYETSLSINYKQIKHRLNSDIELNLYRIIQEQLRNIQKYANARKIEISLSIENNMLMLVIADDGVGFEYFNVKKGIGLANIRRRAELFSGTMEVDSKPGEGCRLIIRIPPANG